MRLLPPCASGQTTGVSQGSATGSSSVRLQTALWVDGKLFALRDGIWTDLDHVDSTAVIAIAPLSEAFFALTRACPELLRPAGLAPAVLVAGRHVSIKIALGEKQSWLPGELDQVVRDFRA
jgi:hypothetical protein